MYSTVEFLVTCIQCTCTCILDMYSVDLHIHVLDCSCMLHMYMYVYCMLHMYMYMYCMLHMYMHVYCMLHVYMLYIRPTMPPHMCSAPCPRACTPQTGGSTGTSRQPPPTPSGRTAWPLAWSSRTASPYSPCSRRPGLRPWGGRLPWLLPVGREGGREGVQREGRVRGRERGRTGGREGGRGREGGVGEGSREWRGGE